MYPWHECLVVTHRITSPCSTQWRVGGWLIKLSHVNQVTSNDEKQKVHNYQHQTRSPGNKKTLKSQKCHHVIDQAFSLTVPLRWGLDQIITFCPFAIFGLAGEPKSVKQIKSGLLIESTTERHTTLPVKVTSHFSINSSKRMKRCKDLKDVS